MTKQDRTRHSKLNGTTQDRMKQCKTERDKREQEKTGQDKIDRTQDRTQDKTRDRRQNALEDSEYRRTITTQDKTRVDET